jgi:YHS domain-containing protein
MRTLQTHRDGAVSQEWTARLFWAVVLVVVLTFVAPRLVVGAESQFWRTDFDAALREAEEKKLPLMMHFYSDWCVPCKQMEQTIFANASVKEMLTTRFVSVKLKNDKYQHLVRQYGFNMLPTDMVIDPFNGKVLVLHSGSISMNEYVKLAQQAEARFKAAHPVPVEPDPVNPSETTEEPTLGEAKPMVGLDGFSPVALVKSRKWNRGSARFAWDYKGVLYFMSSREELVEFRKSPELYAPKFLGCDPVILWETDRAVSGTPDFAAFYNEELFLFKTADRRKQFKSNPQKFIKLQQALKVDQIERTAMR